MSVRAPLLAALSLLLACAAAPPAPTPAACGPTCAELGRLRAAEAEARAPTAADARAFVAETNAELQRLQVRAGLAEWVKSTYITEDTMQLAAELNDAALAVQSQAVKDAARFASVPGLDEATARQLLLLRLNGAGPADPAHRLELTTLLARLEGLYGKGTWCGPDGKAPCRDLEQLSRTLARSRKYDELLDAWVGWHSVAREMKPLYARSVELQNEGARSIGFADTGALWRAGYDMPADAFEKETDRLWQQVKPLYDQLHCYVRGRLQQTYGKDKVPDHQPIPAHLLGNMWAQTWDNVYPLVEPFPGAAALDVTRAMEQQKWDAVRVARAGEAFFVSLGLDPLPKTFWERSMLVKPRDREVVCHASAWNPLVTDDLRIKMCIQPDEESLGTIHHELGHNYYEHAYWKLPWLFHAGANDGFHEAIGDAVLLSVTPAYLKRLGLLAALPRGEQGLINVQLKEALSKVAFLPFGKLIDQWRWDVYAGKTKPDGYNARWWQLRQAYQGVAAPVARSEADFDPGAKYHVPANVAYTRYFLAAILQFQFHRAMCQAAGFKGPLHECSVYGSKEAGKKLQAMLELGASKPWQEALFAMTGSRDMDATAILDYFAPLQRWLEKKNQGQQCGW